jgi:hypothetical protein
MHLIRTSPVLPPLSLVLSLAILHHLRPFFDSLLPSSIPKQATSSDGWFRALFCLACLVFGSGFSEGDGVGVKPEILASLTPSSFIADKDK